MVQYIRNNFQACGCASIQMQDLEILDHQFCSHSPISKVSQGIAIAIDLKSTMLAIFM